MKDLVIRTLTGIIFVVTLISGICIHSTTFLILFCIITGLTVWEFSGLVNHYEKAHVRRILNVIGGMYLFAATFAYAHGFASEKIFLPYLLFLILIMVAELYYKAPNPIDNWAFSLFAQLYCAAPFALLNFIGIAPDGSGAYTPMFILALFVFVWMDDSGAYLLGTLFGKHRLFERISPKKSWEGFWGGLVFALLTSLAFAWFVPEVGYLTWLGLAATTVLFGTWGDLVESLLKRTLQIKDSGNILPGHGGMLDRFDSVILAIPAYYVYIEMFIRN